MKITFQQLKYLTKAAELGSMTDAAKELDISQATLSEAISQIEKELGFRVFSRGRRGIAPTKKGLEALSYARRAVGGMEIFESRFGNQPTPKARFRVSSNPLKIAIAAFNQTVNRAERNTFDFGIAITFHQQPIEDVASGWTDLGVIALSKDNETRLIELCKQNELEFNPLLKVPIYAFFDSTHPLAARARVTREDLAPYPFFDLQQSLRLLEKGPRKLTDPDKEPGLDPDGIRNEIYDQRVAEAYGYRTWCKLHPSHQPNKSSIAVPIEPTEFLKIGYVSPIGAEIPPIANSYIENLKELGMIVLRS